MTDEPAEPPARLDRPDFGGPDPGHAFGLLFDRHAAPLRHYLVRRIGEAVADDLVSETFLIAWNQRHRYDPARAAVRSWLYGIATNLLRRHVRDEVRALRAQPAPDPVDGHAVRVAEQVDAQTAARQLAGPLAALAPGDRDVLLLIAWAGLDTTEVAEALDIPAGTVRSRLHRVRRQLRKEAARG
ncbi:RNA polymerase sigma factor [Amycolatopsis magusensis]|uniref:RNA polymerase sigma-70 factor (ECF subfamily) n=1 Tax=Amycolatopsis magusensis TaxID=882444 RepID=A0ABS4PP52_9PSEU|nr:sigma-70 family RNA polymerase sigma factor [Amycolatopsis magusensis]MBP2180608.1 RNA polymerase sigma-70 factor (ECF subfamily) [Amycolatopsis magusensis]